MFARRHEYRDPDINLIPIMNLFVALIPFLLLSAVFFHLRVIKGSVPQSTEGETDIAKEQKAVTVTVQIDADDGFYVSASSATIPPSQLKKLSRTIPKKSDGTYDYAALSEYLKKLKKEWYESDTVIVVPDPTVKYKQVIETMDAAREIEVVIDGKKHRYKMFPRVVVSSVRT